MPVCAAPGSPPPPPGAAPAARRTRFDPAPAPGPITDAIAARWQGRPPTPAERERERKIKEYQAALERYKATGGPRSKRPPPAHPFPELRGGQGALIADRPERQYKPGDPRRRTDRHKPTRVLTRRDLADLALNPPQPLSIKAKIKRPPHGGGPHDRVPPSLPTVNDRIVSRPRDYRGEYNIVEGRWVLPHERTWPAGVRRPPPRTPGTDFLRDLLPDQIRPQGGTRAPNPAGARTGTTGRRQIPGEPSLAAAAAAPAPAPAPAPAAAPTGTGAAASASRPAGAPAPAPTPSTEAERRTAASKAWYDANAVYLSALARTDSTKPGTPEHAIAHAARVYAAQQRSAIHKHWTAEKADGSAAAAGTLPRHYSLDVITEAVRRMPAADRPRFSERYHGRGRSTITNIPLPARAAGAPPPKPTDTAQTIGPAAERSHLYGIASFGDGLNLKHFHAAARAKATAPGKDSHGYARPFVEFTHADLARIRASASRPAEYMAALSAPFERAHAQAARARAHTVAHARTRRQAAFAATTAGALAIAQRHHDSIAASVRHEYGPGATAPPDDSLLGRSLAAAREHLQARRAEHEHAAAQKKKYADPSRLAAGGIDAASGAGAIDRIIESAARAERVRSAARSGMLAGSAEQPYATMRIMDAERARRAAADAPLKRLAAVTLSAGGSAGGASPDATIRLAGASADLSGIAGFHQQARAAARAKAGADSAGYARPDVVFTASDQQAIARARNALAALGAPVSAQQQAATSPTRFSDAAASDRAARAAHAEKRSSLEKALADARLAPFLRAHEQGATAKAQAVAAERERKRKEAEAAARAAAARTPSHTFNGMAMPINVASMFMALARLKGTHPDQVKDRSDSYAAAIAAGKAALQKAYDAVENPKPRQSYHTDKHGNKQVVVVVPPRRDPRHVERIASDRKGIWNLFYTAKIVTIKGRKAKLPSMHYYDRSKGGIYPIPTWRPETALERARRKQKQAQQAFKIRQLENAIARIYKPYADAKAKAWANRPRLKSSSAQAMRGGTKGSAAYANPGFSSGGGRSGGSGRGTITGPGNKPKSGGAARGGTGAAVLKHVPQSEKSLSILESAHAAGGSLGSVSTVAAVRKAQAEAAAAEQAALAKQPAPTVATALDLVPGIAGGARKPTADGASLPTVGRAYSGVDFLRLDTSGAGGFSAYERGAGGRPRPSPTSSLSRPAAVAGAPPVRPTPAVASIMQAVAEYRAAPRTGPALGAQTYTPPAPPPPSPSASRPSPPPAAAAPPPATTPAGAIIHKAVDDLAAAKISAAPPPPPSRPPTDAELDYSQSGRHLPPAADRPPPAHGRRP